MAAGRQDSEGRKRTSESNPEDDYNPMDEEEPQFSDPEDFIDDITDDGMYDFLYLLHRCFKISW